LSLYGANFFARDSSAPSRVRSFPSSGRALDFSVFRPLFRKTVSPFSNAL
jgi:hypothetical protein